MSDKIKLKKLVNEFDVEKIYTNLSKSNYFYNVDMIFKDKKLNQSFKRKIIRKLKGESVDFLKCSFIGVFNDGDVLEKYHLYLYGIVLSINQELFIYVFNNDVVDKINSIRDNDINILNIFVNTSSSERLMKSFYEFTTFNDAYNMYFSDDRWNLFATSSTLDHTYDFTFNTSFNSSSNSGSYFNF